MSFISISLKFYRGFLVKLWRNIVVCYLWDHPISISIGSSEMNSVTKKYFRNLSSWKRGTVFISCFWIYLKWERKLCLWIDGNMMEIDMFSWNMVRDTHQYFELFKTRWTILDKVVYLILQINHHLSDSAKSRIMYLLSLTFKTNFQTNSHS